MNVANVQVLPVPMLPISNRALATGIGYWQQSGGGIAFGEVGFIMALWKYGIVALCHYGIVRCQFHNGSFSQMNQLQNLSCFRHWEFRSLGDLESLDDSKAPKLQAAKAIIAMRDCPHSFPLIALPELTSACAPLPSGSSFCKEPLGERASCPLR